MLNIYQLADAWKFVKELAEEDGDGWEDAIADIAEPLRTKISSSVLVSEGTEYIPGLEDALAPSVRTSVGNMRLYESALHGFTIRYPAEWQNGEAFPGLTAIYQGRGDQFLFIAEEDTSTISGVRYRWMLTQTSSWPPSRPTPRATNSSPETG